MEQGEYIKQSKTYTVLPSDYNQKFHFPLNLKINETEILKLRARGTITTEDIKVAEFLFDMKFATFKQIKEYMDYLIAKKEIKRINLSKLMVGLLRSRIVNRFYLSTDEATILKAIDVYPSDALSVFCLELGGAYLLDSFSNRDLYEWTTANIIKSSERIGKQLIATEMYLKLLKNCDSKLEFYRTWPPYQVGKVGFKTTLHFCITQDGVRKYFIGDVFRKDNNIADIRNRLIKFESLMCTKAWMKYYPDAEQSPVLIIFADDEEFLKEIAKEVSLTTNIERVRYSTDYRIAEKGLEELGALMKYNKASDQLVEVKSSLFSKKSEVTEDVPEDDITEENKVIMTDTEDFNGFDENEEDSTNIESK